MKKIKRVTGSSMIAILREDGIVEIMKNGISPIH